jgi:hypothetical protein
MLFRDELIPKVVFEFLIIEKYTNSDDSLSIEMKRLILVDFILL